MAAKRSKSQGRQTCSRQLAWPASPSSGGGFDEPNDPARGDVISALVGKGLAKDYPVGSEFNFNDPALGGEVKLKVVGVLAENSSLSPW